jgi:hypothetical protein
MNTPPEIEALNPITERIIGCAIEVHRNLGAGWEFVGSSCR